MGTFYHDCGPYCDAGEGTHTTLHYSDDPDPVACGWRLEGDLPLTVLAVRAATEAPPCTQLDPAIPISVRGVRIPAVMRLDMPYAFLVTWRPHAGIGVRPVGEDPRPCYVFSEDP